MFRCNHHHQGPDNICSHATRLTTPMYFNCFNIVTLASSYSALPDDGDYTETCWSCFNVNFNSPFKKTCASVGVKTLIKESNLNNLPNILRRGTSDALTLLFSLGYKFLAVFKKIFDAIFELDLSTFFTTRLTIPLLIST